MKLKRLSALALTLALTLTACAPAAPVASGTPTPTPTQTATATPAPTPSATTPAERTKVNLAVLKGNTGMSAVKLLSDNEEGTTANDYAVTIAAAPDEVTSKLINGDLDIAALPTNVAATLYNKTDGGVQMLAVCGLGVLYVLEKGDTVHSVADLAGKTLYATGQGANPEYVLNYLLKQNGLEAGKDVTVEWKTADELSTLMASGEIDLAMMPVPAATGVVIKNPDVRFALDFTKEWDAVADHGVLTMSCVAVRTAFAQEHPEAVNAFLKEYAASVDYVKNNVEAGAELVAKYEITPNAKIAAAAIPQINLIYVDGEEMRDSIQGYFEVLAAADPKSVGGGIPADDFYYVG
jgi:NitT/TauT family transport system substrate-binding protein